MKNILSIIGIVIFISCAQTDKKNYQLIQSEFDIVILGGRVMDPETGHDTIKNVGIRDGVIQVISDSLLEGKEVIDAVGYVVAPGFIDTDSYPSNADLQIKDGVTSVLSLRRGTGDINKWYEENLNKTPINYGVAVSYHDIREDVMGIDGNLKIARIEPTPLQFEKILFRLNEEFEKGAVALGMGSSGGFDPAGWELIEIFKIAAKHRAPVIATLRDDFWPESNITANLLQMIGAASLSGVDIHIPHVGSSTGPHISHFLEVMMKARKNGINITAEDYFYRAAEIDVIAGDLSDMTAEEISQIQPMDSNERLTNETIKEYNQRDFEAYYHNDEIEPFIIEAIKSPLIHVASHGSTSKWISTNTGHPRSAGTYSRVLRKYVRDESVISLMDALNKMTLQPANLLSNRIPEMKRKGRIQIGADADLVIFDPDKITDQATYTKLMPSSGIDYVIVNGTIALKHGEILKKVYPANAIRAMQKN